MSEQFFLTPFRGGGKLFINNLLKSKPFLQKYKEVFDSTQAGVGGRHEKRVGDA
jgi:hypothetical protein